MLIEVTDPAAHPALVDDIYAERSLGSIVRALLDRAQVDDALAKLLRADPPRFAIADDSSAYTLGCMLAPTYVVPEGPTMLAYLEASSWRAESILPIQLLDDAMASLAGVPCRVPVADDGRRYARATIHVFPDGSGAPEHRDNYRALACHEHLDRIVDRATQISWYLPLSVPETGGELAIGDQRHRIGPGDLIVFDGGRYDHTVLTSHGSTPRRTFGGFAGRARDGSCLYVWG
jgi:hypothetical protein